jgi:hypothetical protein
MEFIVEELIVPIIICFLLPVAIVWICAAYRRKKVANKAEVLMKALEAGVPCDVDSFIQDKKAMKRKADAARNVKTKMHDHIQTGFILLAIGGAFLIWWIFDAGVYKVFTGAMLLLMGIAFAVSGFVGRKMFADEIAAETKKQVEEITADKTE